MRCCGEKPSGSLTLHAEAGCCGCGEKKTDAKEEKVDKRYIDIKEGKRGLHAVERSKPLCMYLHSHIDLGADILQKKNYR